MTNAELIAHLQKFPSDDKVFLFVALSVLPLETDDIDSLDGRTIISGYRAGARHRDMLEGKGDKGKQ